VLDAAVFDNLAKGLKVSMSHPGTRAFFESHRARFSDEFVRFVRTLGAETPLDSVIGDSARWRTDVAALNARA